jgi:hypothetical protein
MMTIALTHMYAQIITPLTRQGGKKGWEKKRSAL